MTVKRKIIEIDQDLCDGCGNCIISCAEGALEIVDGKARLVAEKYCDGLGACLGECPTGALKIIERDADDFDEAAVEERLESLNVEEKQAEPVRFTCPSAKIQSFGGESRQPAAERQPAQSGPSELRHWPVQINLVPPNAPFLKGADLLVAADCVPVSYAGFHSEFLKDKAVMIGCPKFDDTESYLEKFTEIFRSAGVRSVTVLIMEVPCCRGLEMIIKRAMELSGKQIPVEQVTIGIRGDILSREALVA